MTFLKPKWNVLFFFILSARAPSELEHKDPYKPTIAKKNQLSKNRKSMNSENKLFQSSNFEDLNIKRESSWSYYPRNKLMTKAPKMNKSSFYILLIMIKTVASLVFFLFNSFLNVRVMMLSSKELNIDKSYLIWKELTWSLSSLFLFLI